MKDYTLEQWKAKLWTYDNQKFLLKLLNHPDNSVRYLLGITEKYPIIKVGANSIHSLLENKGKEFLIKANFRCDFHVYNTLAPILEKINITLEDEKYARRIIENPYKSFLHFAELQRSNLPQIFLTTTNFLTGAGDGFIVYANATWSTCRGAATGDTADYTTGDPGDYPNAPTAYITAGNVYRIGRAFYPIDTSALTASATVTGGTMKIYAVHIVGGASTENIYIVQSNVVSNTQLATSDFGATGSTDWGHGDSADSTLNQYALNATGYAAISKTGWTKFCALEGRDFNNTTPTDTTRQTSVFSEGATSAQRPSLDVVYTLPAGGGFFNLI